MYQKNNLKPAQVAISTLAPARPGSRSTELQAPGSRDSAGEMPRIGTGGEHAD